MADHQGVAIITGANRGIGFEVARQLHESGHLVVIGARDPLAAERAARMIGQGAQRARSHRLDITDQDSVTAFAQWVNDEIGGVDILVNNAAIGYDAGELAHSVDLDAVRAIMETNLFGAWRMVQALLPLLRRSSHPRIVNVSSEAGSISEMTGGTPGYSVSKAALNALTRMLAGELAGDRILVNAVCPGWTATDMGGLGGRPVSAGAASVVWAAQLRDTGPTGGFFRDGRPLPW